MIRLLAKSEIVQAKSLERKLEMDEGAKLARKVDALRELQVSEEANLQQFRIATVTQIHEEIAKENQKKEQLLQEVKQLEEQKKKALEPITKELEALETATTQLFEIQNKVNDQITIAKSLNEDAECKRDEVNRLLLQAKTIKDQALREFEQAATERDLSKVLVDEATHLNVVATNLKITTEADLFEKSKNLQNKEIALQDKENTLEKDRLEIEKIKIQLKDREATLERALTRIKK